MKEQWEIHYSRFFNFPDIKSTGLTPLPSRNLRSIGNWVSSPSPASLQLITNPNSRGTVLIVSSLGKIYESFKDAGNSWLPSSNCALPTSLPLELVELNGINARTDAEFCHENHSGNHEPLLLPPSNDEGLIGQCTKEPVSTHHLEAKYAEVPSSFSALLSSSCIQTEQGADAVELRNAPTAMNRLSGMV
ncbi:hypothetical protein CCACVL1_14998, partial [Corchorus capsularis]